MYQNFGAYKNKVFHLFQVENLLFLGVQKIKHNTVYCIQFELYFSD